MEEKPNTVSAELNDIQGNTVSQSASKIAIGGVLSLTAGLANQVIMAWLFGAGTDMDAYLTALVIPSTLAYALIFGLSFVLIPAFIEEENQGSEENAWALVGTFFWLTFGGLVIIAVLGSLVSHQIIAVTAPGLSPEKADLSSKMLSILMFTVPLTGLGSLTKGIQNARNKFFWPSAAGAFGSIGNAVTLLILYGFIGSIALAWGSIANELLTASITVIPILQHGWSRILHFLDQKVLQSIKLVIPFIVLNIITNSTQIFQRYFASGLPDGDLSYLGYASKISNMLIVVLAAGIADAIFPTMARAYTLDGDRGLIRYSEYGLRLSYAAGLPAIAILGVVSVPLITLFFERGAFTHQDTLNVSNVLFIVISAVLFRMLGNIISRTYYVTKDTFTFPLVSAVSVAFYIFFGKVLTTSFGYIGLALAKPLQMLLMVMIAIFLVKNKLPEFRIQSIYSDLLLYTVGSSLAALAAWLCVQITSSWPAVLQLVIACVVAFTLYIGLIYTKDKEIAYSILEITALPRIFKKVQISF